MPTVVAAFSVLTGCFLVFILGFDFFIEAVVRRKLAPAPASIVAVRRLAPLWTKAANNPASDHFIRPDDGTNCRSKKLLQPHINRYIMCRNTPDTTIGRGDLSTLEHTCDIGESSHLYEERAV
jgi:hypothetical protein